MQSNAEIVVSPIIQHFWVNQSTGVFDPGENNSHKVLKHLMLDAYEALSGTRYVPQSSGMASGAAHTGGTQHSTGPSHSTPVASSQLQGRIQSKLQSLDNEELFKLLTDSQAFNSELQSWLRETEAGKQHAQVHKTLLQAAQSSKDLLAVRPNDSFALV